MTDRELIEIHQIKDLKLIYFYNVNEKFKSDKIIGLRVTYGDHKTLNYDYRNKYFQVFADKVLKVYNYEKIENKIILLGDLSKEIVKSNFSFDEEERQSLQKYSIPLFNESLYGIFIYKDYISDLIEQVIRSSLGGRSIKIDKISGYNNSFIANYSIEEIKNNNIPFVFMPISNDTIKIMFNNPFGLKGEITALIEKQNDKVITSWSNNSKSLYGTLEYDYSKKVSVSKTICNDKTYELLEQGMTINQEEKHLFDFYSKLLGIDITDPIKTTKNTYLSFNTINYKEEDSVFIKNTLIDVRIEEDIMKLIKKTNIGLFDNATDIVFNVNETKEKVTLKSIKIEDENYIIEETYYPGVDNSDGIYKSKLEDNFKYRILKVSPDTKLNNVFNYTLDYPLIEEVKTLKNIKTLLRKW